RGADPATEAPHRGFLAGTHFPLIDRGSETLLDQLPADPESPQGRKGTLGVKKDRFNQRASGLGNYETDPQLVLQESIGRRWPDVTKIALINALQEAGAGIIPADGQDPPRH